MTLNLKRIVSLKLSYGTVCPLNYVFQGMQITLIEVNCRVVAS